LVGAASDVPVARLKHHIPHVTTFRRVGIHARASKIPEVGTPDEGDDGIHHSQVDVTTFAGAHLAHQSAADGLGRGKRCYLVRKYYSQHSRTTCLVCLDTHEPRNSLHDWIVDPLFRVWPGLPEAGGADVHYAGIYGLDMLVSDAHPIYDTRSEVLHKHVSIFGEIEQYFQALVSLQIHCKRAFVAVYCIMSSTSSNPRPTFQAT
jgi:hypothetical protein